MAADIYIEHAEGQKQGKFEGNVTQANRKGWILVRAINHEVIAPRDPKDGLPRGKRHHKPINITIELDKSVPKWYYALCNNENLPKVLFRHYTHQVGMDRTTGDAKEKNHYSVELKNATVCSVELWSPNNRDPQNGDMPEQVRIGMVYQKIVWTWEDGGITTEDDWEVPN